MVVNGINTSNIITIRFNKKEYSDFKKLKQLYSNNNNSKIIKSLIFKDFKPFLNNNERQLLITYICELNAIGRNLNQLLKYRAFNDCEDLIKDIRALINESKKFL